MQKEQQLAREIREVEHEQLSQDAQKKIALISAKTGMSEAEVRSLAVARGISASFALSAFPLRTVH